MQEMSDVDVSRRQQTEFLTGDITAELLHDAPMDAANVNGGWTWIPIIIVVSLIACTVTCGEPGSGK